MRIHDVSLAARGRWHTLSATIIGLWIFTGLGLLIAASLGAPVVWWDIIHPFTIGALTTAIIVFSTHFTEDPDCGRGLSGRRQSRGPSAARAYLAVH